MKVIARSVNDEAIYSHTTLKNEERLLRFTRNDKEKWIPAFAGMTKEYGNDNRV